jgi:hypothetical protein
MSTSNLSRPVYATSDAAVDRTELESGLWLFLSAPLSFVATLLIIVVMSRASF